MPGLSRERDEAKQRDGKTSHSTPFGQGIDEIQLERQSAGMLRQIRTLWRNLMSGGDASQWRYDEFSREMRRYVDGAWESRPATPDELEAHTKASTW